MAAMTKRSELGRGVLRVVDEKVDVAGELERRGVVGAEPVRAVAGARRAMVREVGERRACVADPEAEGAPAPMADLAGDHRESLEFASSGLKRAEFPIAAKRVGADRKKGGDMDRERDGSGLALRRHDEPRSSVRAVG